MSDELINYEKLINELSRDVGMPSFAMVAADHTYPDGRVLRRGAYFYDKKTDQATYLTMDEFFSQYPDGI